jgi:hypothetical protein
MVHIWVSIYYVYTKKVCSTQVFKASCFKMQAIFLYFKKGLNIKYCEVNNDNTLYINNAFAIDEHNHLPIKVVICENSSYYVSCMFTVDIF